MKTEKPIIVAGAGLAGLTAAINLAKDGHKMIVHEKNADVGLRHQGQIQGFENFIYDINTFEFLQNLNIEKNFIYKPINNISLISYDLKRYEFYSGSPFVYLIKRGNNENCLDYALKKQAEKLGVKIQFNSRITPQEADIVATGPPKATILIPGISFKTDLNDLIWVIFDDNIAPKGYAYFFVCNGQATIGSFMKHDFKDSRNYLNKTIDAFKKLSDFKIDNEKHFTGFFYFDIKHDFSRIIAGEAAGFQDYCSAAGIKFAMHSGYLAAKNLNNIKNYKNALKKEIYPQQKISMVYRFFSEKLGNKGNKLMCEMFIMGQRKLNLNLRSIYHFKSLYFLKILFFPYLYLKHLFSKKF
ncbi:MAG: FAD-binding protein [Candidatus Saganbacteria bacterium]|nr:FAD-binding protein [Candidatus Saganbacteria bacterium]